MDAVRSNRAVKPTDILADLSSNPASYLSAERRIIGGGFEGLISLNVAVISTFNFDLARPYLVVESAALGMLVRPHFAPFNQLELQVFDSGSPLYQSKPDVVIVAWRLEELAPRLGIGFAALSAEQVALELDEFRNRMHALLEGIRRNTESSILVFNFGAPQFSASGMTDPSLEISQASAIQLFNDAVAAECQSVASAHVFDYARLVQEFGVAQWYDQKVWHMARMPFGIQAQLEIGKRLGRYFRALKQPPCKCLVLDCDNTLWGGILGEDGLDGIQLSEDFPGNVFKDFQRKLLSLKDRGILLALASKNDEEDVLEVFDRHPDTVLKSGDFAAVQVHWNDKASSLQAIAKELNIGTDALAFFDDSAVERDWVQTQMPEVTVIDVPDNPLGYIKAIEESTAFDQLYISNEDRARPMMYREQSERQHLQGQSVSVEDFLERLDMTATVGDVDGDTLARVTQLIGKTNQFNLTTRRHSAADLQKMIDSGAVAIWMRVADRFGDNGLVGVAIAVPVPGDMKRWTVDTFLMSCRVLGREVDRALLSIVSQMVKDKGGSALVGDYIPSTKNDMVSEFYANHGFEPIQSQEHSWQLDLSTREIPWPKVLKLEIQRTDGHGK